MSIKDTLTGEFDHLITRLEAEGHALAARFRAFHGKLVAAEPKVEAKAKTDVEAVEHDAEAAAAPVVAEAVHDAKTTATDARQAVVHAGEYVLSNDALDRLAPAAETPAAPAAASPETAATPTATDAGPAAAAEVTP
jgi:hypothetical protein